MIAIARTTLVVSQLTFGHKCEERNIRLHQGASWRRPIGLVDYLGAVVDITGCTLRGNIRKNALDTGAPLIIIDCSITTAATGFAELYVAASLTSDLTVGERIRDSASLHWYDIELVWSDGDIQRIVEGQARIYRDVTRASPGGLGFMMIGSTFVVS